MTKIRNKKTKVVKEIAKDFEASMYLETGEWELVEEEKPAKAPIFEKEEK